MPAFDPAPLDARSKAERVADLVEQGIREGDLAPGERLGTKSELSARFGVAPTTLDAALRVLSDRGLVVVRQGSRGGVSVTHEQGWLAMGHARWALRRRADDPQAQRQAASVALALEPLIVAEAVSAADDADRAALAALLADLDHVAAAAGEADAAARWHVAHRALHRGILAAAHNATLSDLVPALWATVLDDDAPAEPASPGGDPSGTGVAGWITERVAAHVALGSAVAAADLAAALEALRHHGALTDDLAGFTPGYRALRLREAP